ncbi:MAG TPA: hypothetical protein VEW26_13370 [Allosphingosinicella sp.]|nr:hypothetical protein [Allosphingosinicella sp.]
MTIEVIDGTVESAALKSSNAKVAMYDRIVIRAADGSERRLDKVAVSPSLSAMVEPGTHGRFYGYKAIDHRGLYAARTRDGRSAFAIPTGNEKIMLMMAIVGLGGFAIMLLFGSKIGLLSLVLGVLGVVGYFRYRRDRLEARARYDGDSDYA